MHRTPHSKRKPGIKKDQKAIERFEKWQQKRKAVLEKRQRVLENLNSALRGWVLEDSQEAQAAAAAPSPQSPQTAAPPPPKVCPRRLGRGSGRGSLRAPSDNSAPPGAVWGGGGRGRNGSDGDRLAVVVCDVLLRPIALRVGGLSTGIPMSLL